MNNKLIINSRIDLYNNKNNSKIKNNNKKN